MQGRGVLINLFRHFGERRHAVIYDYLMCIFEQDQVVVEPSDILSLWTGFGQMIMAGNGHPNPAIKQDGAVLNGWDRALLRQFTGSCAAAITPDSLAIEAVDIPTLARYQGSSLPLYEHNHLKFDGA